MSGSAIASRAVRAEAEGSGEPETVEESGPVVYSEGEEEDEEGLGDADMDELAYEGDPLLYSDYEDEGNHVGGIGELEQVIACMLWSFRISDHEVISYFYIYFKQN